MRESCRRSSPATPWRRPSRKPDASGPARSSSSACPAAATRMRMKSPGSAGNRSERCPNLSEDRCRPGTLTAAALITSHESNRCPVLPPSQRETPRPDAVRDGRRSRPADDGDADQRAGEPGFAPRRGGDPLFGPDRRRAGHRRQLSPGAGARGEGRPHLPDAADPPRRGLGAVQRHADGLDGLLRDHPPDRGRALPQRRGDRRARRPDRPGPARGGVAAP